MSFFEKIKKKLKFLAKMSDNKDMKKSIISVISLLTIVLILNYFQIKINLELFKNILFGFGLFTLTVSPLIIIHEYAHYWVGKKLGADPEVFSLGMGPKIWSFRKGMTEFAFSLIPIGGYVRFRKVQFNGENANGVDEKIESYKWFWIALAGPISNLMVAIAIFFSLFLYATNQVKQSTSDQSSFELIHKDSQLASLIFAFNQNDSIYFRLDQYKVKNSTKSGIYESIPLKDKMIISGELTYRLIVHFAHKTADTFKSLFTNFKETHTQISGPIGIAQQVNFSINLGWMYVLIMIASVSFGLAFMNALPLSVLDGGRALMSLYQTFIREDLNLKALNFSNQISLALVLSLMAIGFVSDLSKSGSKDLNQPTEVRGE